MLVQTIKNWHRGGMGMKDYKITISQIACLKKKKKTWAPQTAECMAYFFCPLLL